MHVHGTVREHVCGHACMYVYVYGHRSGHAYGHVCDHGHVCGHVSGHVHGFGRGQVHWSGSIFYYFYVFLYSIFIDIEWLIIHFIY